MPRLRLAEDLFARGRHELSPGERTDEFRRVARAPRCSRAEGFGGELLFYFIQR